MTENNLFLSIIFNILNIFYIISYTILPNYLKNHSLSIAILCIFSLNLYLSLYHFLIKHRLPNYFYYKELFFYMVDFILYLYIAYHFPFFIDLGKTNLFRIFGNYSIFISFVMISVQTYALLIFSVLLSILSIFIRIYNKTFLKYYNIKERGKIFDVIKKFPTILPNIDQTCIICLEEANENNENNETLVWKKLDCTHTFHSQCLSEWFLIDISCPICRKEF